MAEGSLRDGTRNALIVATSRYEDSSLQGLRGASADADALAQVLSDPRIGAFDVRTVLDQPAHVVAEAVEEFFSDRSPEDLLVFHFSGHGIKNQDGELHFAASNTKLTRLGSTAVAAQFVNRQMNACRSRRIVLLLDCCYAGAFDRGMAARSGRDLDIKERFGGRGRAVITASGALEYAFEGTTLSDDQGAQPSIFTSAMVRGLTTGEADRNQDGWVGLDELYDYIFDAVREATPDQTPGKWTFGLEGDLHLARRGRPVTVPSPLPPEVQQSLESPLAGVRAGTIQDLSRLVKGHHAGLALGAQLALQHLAEDDSRSVAAAAAAAMRELGGDAEHREPGGRTADGTPAGSGGRAQAITVPTEDTFSGREPGLHPSSHSTTSRRRRILLALATVVVLLVSGALVGWSLWRDDSVDTIPAGMGGVWNADIAVYGLDYGVTVRLTAGSGSGRQLADPASCRLIGTFSQVSGTRSRVTMSFRPDGETADCLIGTGTLILSTQDSDTLLAEFHPEDGGQGFWDARLTRQGG